MKSINRIQKTQILLAFLLLFSTSSFAQSPGGVASTATTQGLRFDFYAGSISLANLRAANYGAFRQSGYTNTAFAINENVSNKGTYTFVAKGNITVTGATYFFEMPFVDDAGVILVNGIEVFAKQYGFVAAVNNSITLAAGTYSFELRYTSDNILAACPVYWRSTVASDATTSASIIPDSKFSMNTVLMGGWYKADAGITGTDGNPATVWADQSANTNKTNLTTIGGNPTYRTTTKQLNFNPTVEFSSSGRLYSGTYAHNFSYRGGNQTIIVVAASASATESGTLVGYGNDLGNGVTSLSQPGTASLNSNITSSTISAGSIFTGAYLNPVIGENSYDKSLANNNHKLFVNGSTTPAAQATFDAYREMNDNGEFVIGGTTDGNTAANSFSGIIGEVITFPWALTAVDRKKVNSYLGIKYGITLDAGASSYIFSDGTDMWTPTSNVGYINDIAGISRDDASALYQKQSISSNSNPFVTLGLTTIAPTNAANTNTISSDKSSFVWSANMASMPTPVANFSYSISVNGFNTVLDKRWKVQIAGAGFAGKTIRVAVSTANTVLSAASSYLIVSTTGAFNAANETYYALSVSGSYLYADVPVTVLANGTYFSFGCKIIAPGGVVNSLAFWSKTDAAGNLASKWADNSLLLDSIPNVGGLTLSAADANHNFLPYITGFSSTKYFLNNASLINPLGTGDYITSLSIFSVIRPTATATTAGKITGIDPTASAAVQPSLSITNAGKPRYFSYNPVQLGNTSTAVLTASKPTIVSVNADQLLNSGNGAESIALDGIGQSFNRPAGNFYRIGSNKFNIGYDNFGGDGSTANGHSLPLSGDIMEVFWYTKAQTANELSRINTYLSIKHGSTLGTFAAPVDYLNTNSVTIWSTAASTYHNNVAGIGRDDNEALDKKQSRSVNDAGGTDKQVTIGLGTISGSNAANTNVFTNDVSYLVWGDNNISTTFATDYGASGAGAAPSFTYNGVSTNRRMKRIWKVMSTNFSQNVKTSVVAANIIGTVTAAPSGCQRLCLITATDAAFTTGITVTVLTLNGSNYEATVKFPSGTAYFTYGLVQEKPDGTINLPIIASTPVPKYSGCMDNGWRYYYSDGTAASGSASFDGTKKIFAIYANGNTIPATLTGNVTYQAAPYTASACTNQVNIMGRLLTITDPTAGTYAAGGGMKVRVFYSDAELAASIVSPPITTQKWFTYPGNAAATVAANNGISVVGSTTFTGLTTGTEDGISYVEYAGIQSFSTLTAGYQSTSIINPAGQWIGGASGDWNTASNWCGGVPTSATNVVIPSGTTVYIQSANAVANSVSIANTASLVMTAAYNLGITAGGTFTNNGTFTATSSTGTVAFLGNGSISGTTTFKNIDTYGALDFGTASTVSGTFSIQPGGSVTGNSPTYTCPSAVLLYKPGTGFNRGLEWTNSSSGAGYPANVTIQNNTSVRFPATGDGYICNDLTIDNGSNLLQNYSGGSAAVRVGRNVTISGTLSLGSSAGGDIYLGGNWVRNTGGIFNHNDRMVTFDGPANFSGNGSSMSTITAPASLAKDNEGGFGGEQFALLTVNKTNTTDSVVLLSNITVTRELGFTKGTFSLRNSDVTLVSNSTRTADIAPITTPANTSIRYAGTGRFVVQRFIQNPTAKRSWRLLTAPLQAATAPSINQAWQEGVVNPDKNNPNASGGIYNPWPGYGLHITGPGGTYSATNGYDQGTNASSILFANSGVTAWTTPASTTSIKVTDQPGWMLFVRGDRSFVIGNQYVPSQNTTLEPKGKINTGDVVLPVAAAKQIVGNPYASAISLLNVDFAGTAGKNSTYYMWDPKMFTSYTQPGKWVTFTGTGSSFVQTTSASPYTTNGKVESGQAFAANITAAGNITFHESDKLDLNSSLVGIANARPASPVTDPIFALFRSDIYAKNDTAYQLTDGVLNIFSQGYDNAANDADAPKFINFNTKESLGIIRDSVKMAIEKRSDIQDADTIFFTLTKFNELPYQFRFQASDFAPGLQAFLEDNFTGLRTPISTSGNTNVDFDITTDPLSKAENRFRIVFKLPYVVLPVSFTSVKATQQHKNIAVQWTVSNELNIQQYEVQKSSDGAHFEKVNTTPAQGNYTGNRTYSWLDEHAAPGNNYYRIVSNGTDANKEYSKVVMVTMPKEKEKIAIYPNPVTDGIVRLYVENMEAGNYTIRILNATGQLVYSSNINHTGANGIQQITIGHSIAKGSYTLELNMAGKQKTTLQLIIE